MDSKEIDKIVTQYRQIVKAFSTQMEFLVHHGFEIGGEALAGEIERFSSLSVGGHSKGRYSSLKEIREVIGDCHRCPLHASRSQIVFGKGDPDARLIFVGEAPGHEEDLQGEPFVGAAGRILTSLLRELGYERDEVYITNTNE